MYAAILPTGELIYARQVKPYQETQTFYCPRCRQELIFKRSRRHKPFFSHRVPCGQDPGPRSNQESPNHQKMKAFVAEAGRSLGRPVQVEQALGSDQIADVLISWSDRPDLVVECQCSVIPAQDLAQRSQGYQSLGYQDLWLLDEKSFQGQRVTAWHKRCLDYNETLGFHWRSLDLTREAFVLRTNLPIIYHRQCLIHWQVSYEAEELLAFVDGQATSRSRARLIYVYGRPSNPDSYRTLLAIQRSRQHQPLLEGLYLQGLSLGDLPEWILQDQWQILLVQGLSWPVFALSFLFFRRLEGRSGNLEELSQALLDWEAAGWVAWVVSPWLSSDQTACHVARALVDFFDGRGMIDWDQDRQTYTFVWM